MGIAIDDGREFGRTFVVDGKEYICCYVLFTDGSGSMNIVGEDKEGDKSIWPYQSVRFKNPLIKERDRMLKASENARVTFTAQGSDLDN